MKEPHRLSSKLYKARYFADCHFLQSKLGNNPSFIWRSIWEAKHVVSAGTRWKVGNGKEINILHQPWLQDGTNPYITTELQGLDNATVHSLRTEDGQQCDREILEDLFNQRDQSCIYNVQIVGESEADTLYWNEDISGEYTVRSAYRLLRLQKETSFTAESRDLWKLIWRIKAPLKVLNHIWRASSQCLPRRTNLQAKRVPVPVLCPMCNGEEETTIHVLVSCPFAA